MFVRRFISQPAEYIIIHVRTLFVNNYFETSFIMWSISSPYIGKFDYGSVYCALHCVVYRNHYVVTIAKKATVSIA